MAIPKDYKGKYFFHFTHIDNLKDIAINGLLSVNEKNNRGLSHLNVANSSIQGRRSSMQVACGPGGVVHDYVPFYFCPRTPMFFKILSTKNFDQCLLVFICISIEKLDLQKFVFTDSAANRALAPNFYDDPTDLDKLSWDEIEKKSWSASATVKHKKMAEALCHQELKPSEIDYIVTWNKDIKEEVEEIFKKEGVDCPDIKFDGENGYYHYITWFGGDGESGCSRVTGPQELEAVVNDSYDSVLQNREKLEPQDCPHQNLKEILISMKKDFELIEALESIVGLETNNKMHSENVDDHTRTVVEKLKELEGYKEFSNEKRMIMRFCAYMHDVGKGPSSRWREGIQKPDDTHSKRSVLSAKKLLSTDIVNIEDEDIYTILVLIGYHDVVGDSIIKERDISCLKNIKLTREMVEMLFLLNEADVLALGKVPEEDKWSNLKLEVLGFIDD